MTEDQRKYLDYLQAVITRMASNSFALKGWSVGLGSAIIGLAAKDGQPKLAWIALVPVVVFWALDGYYLGLERAYRTLYERAVPDLLAAYHPGTAAPTEYDLRVIPPDSLAWRTAALSASVALVHAALVVIALVVTAWAYRSGPASAP